MSVRLASIVTLLGFTFALPAMAGADLAAARKLLEQSKPTSAYEQLSPYESEMAGNLEYDYLLGAAALEAGYPLPASLALERVIAQDPRHAGARLDLARAWLAMGQTARAKQEFLILQQLNPPENARQVIAANLTQIEQTEKAATSPQTTGYIEGGLGHDDNITSITGSFSQAAQQTYGFIGLTPTGNAVKREDNYLALGGGIAYSAPIKTNTSFILNVDARQRNYLQEHDFDTTWLSALAGMQWKQGDSTWKAGLLAQSYWQQGAAVGNPRPSLDHDFVGGLLDWRHQVSPRDQLGLSLQLGRMSYPDMSYADNNQYTLSGSWLHALEGRLRPILFSNLYYIQEDARHKLLNGSDYSRSTTGARIGAQISLNPALDVFGLAGYQLRQDDTSGARASNITGQDEITDLTLGLNWKLDKNWSLIPRINWMHNSSNIALYSFDRTDISVMLRRDFR